MMTTVFNNMIQARQDKCNDELIEIKMTLNNKMIWIGFHFMNEKSYKLKSFIND